MAERRGGYTVEHICDHLSVRHEALTDSRVEVPPGKRWTRRIQYRVLGWYR